MNGGEQPPLLSPFAAWLLSAFFATSYVASLYLFPDGRLKFSKERVEVGQDRERARAINERWRNDPSTIRARLSGVALSTLLSCLLVFGIVTKTGTWAWGDSEAVQQSLRLLGLTFSDIPLGAWVLAPLLYTGSFYIQMLDQQLPFQRRWSTRAAVQPIVSTWMGFRNIIAAPITEELVYRSCIVAVMKLSNASSISMIFLSPLWFGAAHLHHGWDLFNRFGKTWVAFKRAATSVVFQQLYTSLFGIFEVFLLLRTGSIFPCIFAHSFCNLYGVPIPMGGIRRHPRRKIDIIAAHLVGLITFMIAIGPWTRTA